eukprot:3253691-Rhodomonas_salina.7
MENFKIQHPTEKHIDTVWYLPIPRPYPGCHLDYPNGPGSPGYPGTRVPGTRVLPHHELDSDPFDFNFKATIAEPQELS